MRASSEGFLPSTRSHVHGIGKMCRKGFMCGCVTCHMIQEKEEEEEKEEIMSENRQIERKEGL